MKLPRRSNSYRARPRPAVERHPSRLARTVTVVLTTVIAVTGYVSVAHGDDQASDLTTLQNRLQLITSDEFSGAAGQLPAARLWGFRTGGGGWGNKELQNYTDQPANVATNGRGQLAITARRQGKTITSARVDTLSTFSIQNGMVQVRAKLPEGQGLHPAIWMLGSSIATQGYPASGEIDIVEFVGQGTRSTSALHGPKYDSSARYPWRVQKPLAPDTNLSKGYHTYWVDKTPGRIRIGVDNATRAVFTPADLAPDARWVMDEPFFIVLNLAVGGVSAGPPAATSLPATMLVDWMRVYQ